MDSFLLGKLASFQLFNTNEKYNPLTTYQQLPVFNPSKLNILEAHIHHVAQFLAMFGSNYVQNEPDDSHTNLAFEFHSSSIYSRGQYEMSIRVVLQLLEWKIIIEAESGIHALKLANKTKDSIYKWLKIKLLEVGLNSELLKYISHYKIPSHPFDKGDHLPKPDQDTLNIWLIMRSNANLLLSELNTMVGVHSEIRIWPHHFDTGVYYPLTADTAIGAGWAIADSICNNPYFYIYGWNKNRKLNYSAIPKLKAGHWVVTKEWQGAIIESVDLSQEENQYERLHSFFQDTAGFFLSQLKR